MKKKAFYIFLTGCIALLMPGLQPLHAQFKIKGTVYDSSRIYPLEAVTVLSTGGKGTFSDTDGNYEIDVNEKDSIWFSYLGKPTVKYPVLKMNDPLHFDIALHVNTTVLREVKIMPRNYRLDSIQNRIDYAKVFDYEKPRLKTSTGGGAGGVGVGFDLDELIRMFQFRKNKNMVRFQERLLEQEQEKFIDHRFNKQLVRRLTNLSNEKLDSFMIIYRPSYQFTLIASDYEFQSYIKICYEKFIAPEGTKEKTF